jgi:hypothetical protein
MTTTNLPLPNNIQGSTYQGAFTGSPTAPTATLPPAQGSAIGTTINVNGITHINNGSQWSALVSPTYSNTNVATTSWVQSALQGQTTLQGSNGKSISIDSLLDFVETMKRRMCILDVSLEKHELYPALKEAYENYLIIERLCCGDDKDSQK